MGELKNGIEQHPLTEEEARKGGQKSGETRRRKKDLKMCLNILMEQELSKDKNGNSVSGAEALALKAFREALDGNPKFWEIVTKMHCLIGNITLFLFQAILEGLYRFF